MNYRRKTEFQVLMSRATRAAEPSTVRIGNRSVNRPSSARPHASSTCRLFVILSSMCLSRLAALLLICFSAVSAAEAPRLLQKDGRYALLVDGKPFLVLGGQIHNSSAWPSELPQVWASMEALHANTIEAPTRPLSCRSVNLISLVLAIRAADQSRSSSDCGV